MARLASSIIHGELTVTGDIRLTNDGSGIFIDNEEVFHTGNFTDNSGNWNSAYNDVITGVSGNGDGTLTLTRRDGGTLTTSLNHSHGYGDLPISSGNVSNWNQAYNNYITGVSGNGDSTLTLNQRDGGSISTNLSHSHSEYMPKSGGTFSGNVLFGGSGTYTSGSSIALALGDSDTGFDWISDGIFEIRSDGDAVAQVGKNVKWDFKVTPSVNGNNIYHTGNKPSKSDVGLSNVPNSDHTAQGYLTSLPSHNHDGRYFRSGDTPDFHAIDFSNNERDDFTIDGRLYWDLSAGLYIQSSNAIHSDPALLWSSANFTAGTGLSVSYDAEDHPTLYISSSYAVAHDHDSSYVKKGVSGESYSFGDNRLTFSYLDSGNADHIRSNDGDNAFHFVHDNSYNATGNSTLHGYNFVTHSDRRLKTDIVKIDDPLSIIDPINLYTFRKKDRDNHEVGLIAQEVMEGHPLLVHTTEHEDLGESFTLAAHDIAALAVGGVKALKAEVDYIKDDAESLRGRINILEKENIALREEITELKNN